MFKNVALFYNRMTEINKTFIWDNRKKKQLAKHEVTSLRNLINKY